MKISRRGFTLMIAMAVTVMMTLLGTMALDAVNIDLTLARTDRASQRALLVSEAGVTWAMEKLRTSYGFETDSPSYSTVLSLSKVQDVDPTCTAPSTCKLYDWRQLPGGESVSYGGGTFRAAVKDDDDGDLSDTADRNSTILIRSLGTVESASRLIENVVTTQ